MENPNRGSLQVPALRAKMGDWIYYSAFMKMSDIAERVSLADEIHRHKELRDMIQRTVDDSGHAEAIKTYLLTQSQRFFNSLVVGVYGGDPDFYELKIGDSPRMKSSELPTYLDGALGILKFTGEEKMFAIDGQHRVVGIKKAIAKDKTLGSDEVIVLLVGHKKTDLGMERSRRLFTTLNRYAKPVSKADIIALDEDDIVAIMTRRLVEEHPFFSKFLLVKKGKAIAATDKRFFTTLEALYDVIGTYMQTETKEWKEARKLRPTEAYLQEQYEHLVAFWDLLISRIPEVKALQNSVRDDEKAADYRSRNGGHILYRPAGLMIVVESIKWLIDEGYTLRSIIDALAKVPMQLTGEPWTGLLWDATNRRMIMSADNRNLAERLLVYGLTGSATMAGRSELQLKREWAGVLGRSTTRGITLPIWKRITKTKALA
jgi:DNA sulfur modification protein DndB